MEWTADVSAGDWIRGRLDDGPGWGATMHGVVPRGFPAYAQIRHAPAGDAESFRREEGRLDAAQLSTIATHLAHHTGTPDDVYAAVWDGWGGLVGFYGQAPARAVLAATDDEDPALMEHHRAMLERSIRDPFNNVFRKPVWQPGILSDGISRGPRLRLPDRDHILFTGRITELADPSWASTVPWADESPEWTASPSLIWPADRAWVLVTDVDADATIVGGNPDLVRALCTEPALEARAMQEGAGLSWDEVSR